MRVLALPPHPIEGPGARYRVYQFAEPLRKAGIELVIEPFFDRDAFASLYTPGDWLAKARALAAGTSRRAAVLARGHRYDALFIHIWLHPITFPPFDLALRALRMPIVYDIDDAYYGPVGSMADRLRDSGWTRRLMRSARVVIAGSPPIRDVVARENPSVEVLPTAVDTDRFTPRDFEVERNPLPVIGWVGSHSTARFLEPLLGVLRSLARERDFVLRVVGAGREVRVDGVRVENVPWRLEHEVAHFRQLDIGLYPLEEGQLASAKHGFKLRQYQSVGIPAVASDAGLNRSIVRHGQNAFLASTLDDWHTLLARLLEDESLRGRVGAAGRASVLEHASLAACAARLAAIFRRVTGAEGDRTEGTRPATKNGQTP